MWKGCGTAGTGNSLRERKASCGGCFQNIDDRKVVIRHGKDAFLDRKHSINGRMPASRIRESREIAQGACHRQPDPAPDGNGKSRERAVRVIAGG